MSRASTTGRDRGIGRDLHTDEENRSGANNNLARNSYRVVSPSNQAVMGRKPSTRWRLVEARSEKACNFSRIGRARDQGVGVPSFRFILLKPGGRVKE